MRVKMEFVRENTDDTAVEAVDATDALESALARPTVCKLGCSERSGFDFLQGHLNEFCREGVALLIGSSDGSSWTSGNEGPEAARSWLALRDGS